MSYLKILFLALLISASLSAQIIICKDGHKVLRTPFHGGINNAVLCQEEESVVVGLSISEEFLSLFGDEPASNYLNVDGDRVSNIGRGKEFRTLRQYRATRQLWRLERDNFVGIVFIDGMEVLIEFNGSIEPLDNANVPNLHNIDLFISDAVSDVSSSTRAFGLGLPVFYLSRNASVWDAEAEAVKRVTILRAKFEVAGSMQSVNASVLLQYTHIVIAQVQARIIRSCGDVLPRHPFLRIQAPSACK